MKQKSIIISADLFPTESNEQLFINGNIEELFGNDILKELRKSSARVFNIEGPFVTHFSPIKKSGPVLCARSDCFNAIKELNPTVLSLANNHILDHGENGINSTIKLCNENNIKYVGICGGKSKNHNYQTIELDNVRVAIYSCAEHEFSFATTDNIGANPFDPFVVFDEIREIKKAHDYVIVLYHGGREEYRYPTPQIRRIFYKFAEVGADIVINQHSHCIGCFEKKDNSTLIYGQGNFIFDAGENQYWGNGLLIKVVINEQIDVEYIPIVKSDNKVRMANEYNKDKIMNSFYDRSSKIKEDNYIEKKYSAYVSKMIGSYLVSLHCRNFFWKAINKITKGKVWKYVYRGKRYYALLNALRCESHYELLKSGLENLNEKNIAN